MARRVRIAFVLIAAPLVWFAGFRWLDQSTRHMALRGITLIVRHDSWYVPALVVWTLCVLTAAWLIARRTAGERADTDGLKD